MNHISYAFLSFILMTSLTSCVHRKPISQNEVRIPVTISADNGETWGFLQTNGLPAKQKSFFSVHSDHEKIHITAECHYPENIPLRIYGNKPGDITLFAGEHIEIFLCTNPKKGVYYQFALSPNGCVYTAQGHNTKWQPDDWSKQIHIGKDRWKVELALPYSIFGITKPGTGDVWGVNFCRRYAPVNGSHEDSSWCGIADYHAYQQYNSLAFKPLKSEPNILLTEFQFDEKCMVHAGFALQNLPDPVTIRIRNSLNEYAKDILPNTKSVCMDCNFNRFYIPLKENARFTITVQNKRTGKICYIHNICTDKDFSKLLIPDKFYYTPEDEKISFTMSASGIPSMPEHPVFNVTLSQDEIILRKQEFTDKGEFSLKNLKPGRYVLKASNGTIITSRVVYYLEKHDPISGFPEGADFKIKGKIFTAGRKPVFMVAGSATGKPLPKDICFNMNAGNFGTAPGSVSIIGLGGKRYNRSMGCYLYQYDSKEEFFDMISKTLKKIKRQSPQFFRMTYEAQLKTCFQAKDGTLTMLDSAKWHNEYYNCLKKKFPDFYFSLQTDREQYVPLLSSSCDIFEVTPTGGYHKNMMPALMKSLPEAARIAGKKPVICWLGATIPDNQCRIAEELRGAVFYNIIHDTAGVIFHLGHGALPQSRTRIWSLIKHINGEIQEFYPEFRSMPLLEKAEAEKILKIQGDQYAYVVRGSGNNAIAVVMNLLPSENFLKFKIGNGYAASGRHGLAVSKSYEWLSTPYEAAVIRLHKK